MSHSGRGDRVRGRDVSGKSDDDDAQDCPLTALQVMLLVEHLVALFSLLHAVPYEYGIVSLVVS